MQGHRPVHGGAGNMTDSELLNPSPRTPVLSAIERSAYVAAHSIVSRVWCVQLAMTGESEFFFPSVRRSRLVDEIAAVIADSVESGCLVMSKPGERELVGDFSAEEG